MAKQRSRTYCPNNHGLPHEGPEGNCTPIRCGDGAHGPRSPEGVPDPASLVPLAKVEKREQGLVALAKAREALVSVPSGLSGDAAETWTVRKLHDLAPYAAAEVEYQLKFGGDRQRIQAALEVLDRTGHGRKGEGGSVGGPVIVVNVGRDGLPWAPKAQVVEVKDVEPDERQTD